MDYTVQRIFHGRILEWVAVPFSQGSSHPRDWTHISYVPCIGRQILYRCTTNSYVLKCLINKITSVSVTFRETRYIYYKMWTWCVLALAFLGGVGEGVSSAWTGSSVSAVGEEKGTTLFINVALELCGVFSPPWVTVVLMHEVNKKILSMCAFIDFLCFPLASYVLGAPGAGPEPFIRNNKLRPPVVFFLLLKGTVLKTQAQLTEATVLDIWVPKWFKTPVSRSHLKKDLSSRRLLVGGKYLLELENLTVSFTGFSFSISFKRLETALCRSGRKS